MSVTPPPGGRTVRTKAVELTVEGVERVHEIGGRQARPGYEFVIVDTSWKNVIPLTPVNRKDQGGSPTAGFGGFGTAKHTSTDPGDIEMKPTPYVVPMLAKQMWLFTDGRYADTVDLAALEAVPDHFSKDGFGIPKLDDVVRGKVVFEAPVSPKYQAFQFYDIDRGHALIPIVGAPVVAPPLGPARENDLVRLEAGAPTPAPAGMTPSGGQRAVVVTLRGSSRSPKDIVDIPVRQFVFAQTDRGCVSRPEEDPPGLNRAFGEFASFPPTGANEGQLVFFVPENTRALRVLVRPQRGALDVPAPADFQPSWPTPVRTITDGTTLRLHVLPTPGPPVNLPPLQAGRAYQLLDLVVENLKPAAGIELQYVQVRLQAADGSFIDPSPLSLTVPCALPGDGVIPAAAARRFVLVYDIPADAPARRLNYRGFEVDETTVDLP